MKRKFKSLTDYINSIESTEDKIRTLIDVMNSSLSETIVQKEANEFKNVLNSILFVADNKEDEPLHINKEESLKRLDMLFKIQAEYHEKAIEERNWWELYVENKCKDTNYTAEQKKTMGDFYHYMTSEANNMHATITSLYFNIYGSESFNQLASQLEDGETIYEGIEFDKKNNIGAFAERMEYRINEVGNDYSKNFMNGETVKVNNPILLDRLMQNPISAEEVKCVSEWIQYESATSKEKPWMDEDQIRDFNIKVYGKTGIWTKNPDEMEKKMQQINSILEDLDKHMNSTLWDSDEYKHMFNSLKAVTNKYKELTANGNHVDTKNATKCRNLLNEAMKNAADYVGTHITERVTPNGKARFKAAMSVVSVCNMDSATAIKEIVDKVRGPKSEQKVNFEAIAAKYSAKLDKPFAYEWMRTRDEVKNAPSLKVDVNKENEKESEISKGWEIINFSKLDGSRKTKKIAGFNSKNIGNKELIGHI